MQDTTTRTLHKCLKVFISAFLLTISLTAAAYAQIKAVTYFGDQWPVNFLNSEHADAESDFAAIRRDGFNTVIYCVPWSEVQPDTSSTSFNETALSKLDSMLSRAEAAGLNIMLRLGYTWDYSGAPESSSRFSSIFYDDSIRSAWRRYAARVYSLASSHPGFAGAFITWEDFWSGLSGSDAASYRRFDERISSLLQETQGVFPGLSLECRLDRDPYYSGNAVRYYDHQATFSCADAPFSCAMLSVSMGWADGTVLDPGNAASKSAENLSRFMAGAGKPVFIDQFLYMETTPGYERLAKLPPSSVNAYLAAMGQVFASSQAGYGLWTYRDYADSIVYNPEFGLHDKGWGLSGGAELIEDGGNHRMHLPEGASVSQNLQGRGFASSENTKVSFLVFSGSDTTVTVNVSGVIRTADIHPGMQTVLLDMGSQVCGSLMIRSAGDIQIDNIKVYSHVTGGGIYDINNAPGPYLSGIRAMNAR